MGHLPWWAVQRGRVSYAVTKPCLDGRRPCPDRRFRMENERIGILGNKDFLMCERCCVVW
jgi:hypothetical protein